MNTANQRKTNSIQMSKTQKTNDIKPYNNTKSNEFSKNTNICITAGAMALTGFVYLLILI